MSGIQRSPRIPWTIATIALLGCAGQDDPGPFEEPIDSAALWVFAQPKGHTFDEDTTVTLIAARPSSLYYTVDGTAPTGESATMYSGPLNFDGNVLLMFIAVDGSGVWSKPQTELYERSNILNATPLDSSLFYEDTILLFSPKPGVPHLDKVLRIRSDGVEPVRIAQLSIAPNPDASSFFREDAFELVDAPEQVVNLGPDEVLDITIRYHTTETIRSAVLLVESNNERARDGQDRVALWGRLEP